MYRYRPKPDNDVVLRQRLRELAAQRKRFGSPRLHILLKRENLVINHKRTERIYREEGLSLRRKRRKKGAAGVRVMMPSPQRPNQRWSMDFVSDQLANGRRFRVLNVVDHFSRELVLQVVDLSISGQRLARELSQLADRRPMPRTIVCDNGPEFTSKAMYFWAKKIGVKLHFIQPGKPTQNAFVESFNGKMRAYCLDLHWFASIEDARSTIDDWQRHYNHVRPHRSLGKKPPAVFAKEAA